MKRYPLVYTTNIKDININKNAYLLSHMGLGDSISNIDVVNYLLNGDSIYDTTTIATMMVNIFIKKPLDFFPPF